LGPDIASKISQFLQGKNYPINKVMTAYDCIQHGPDLTGAAGSDFALGSLEESVSPCLN